MGFDLCGMKTKINERAGVKVTITSIAGHESVKIEGLEAQGLSLIEYMAKNPDMFK